MFGRDVSRTRLARTVTTRSPAIVASGVSLGRALKPVDVTVNYGEVLALSGASGAGASELASLLAGVAHPSSGTIRLTAADGHRTTTVKGRDRAVGAGIGYLPANRKRDGLLLERSISENLLIVPQRGAGDVFYWPPRGRRLSRQAVADGNVKAGDVSNRVMTLSGGNQQKVILARWMLAGSRVLVLDEPTAGIDVASKFEIYRRLLDLAGEGFAVVIVSSDYEEIACLADRVLLMRDGTITAELDGEESTAEELYQREMAGAA
jgi:ABC-type sugar transport system ATPase subunit